MDECDCVCSVGDIMLVDGGLSTLKILSKTSRDVQMEVVDGGKLTSRCARAHQQHLRSGVWCSGGTSCGPPQRTAPAPCCSLTSSVYIAA